MSETCQKLAFTHPIVVLKSGLKNNWMKKLDRVSRRLERVNFHMAKDSHLRDYLEAYSLSSDQVFL